ncbi:MAG: Crp/Fnr family transcriptional regulator [Candidatus Eremiobacteraeota bacterium]|nr:Crp/Fnr family transcriptional regulator [Candidatus Eremiobacteraeota bacterium]MCW5866916.1 Crp/Fnr family transcriptional regulator [Candidatus Eremiobacteraeota bacterium]
MRKLNAGDILWEAGEASTFVVWVEEGILEVVQHSLQGEDAVLNRLGVGELAGEMSCLDGNPHSATLRAAGPVVVRVMDRQAFLEWLREHPERIEKLFHRQSQRIRGLSARLAEVSFDPVQLRLARFLLTQNSAEWTITQQQLAEYLAATRESVSKALSAFGRSGWVKTGRGKLAVLDRQALEQLVADLGS